MKFQGNKVLVIGDVHDSPKLSKDRLTWIGKYARKSKPDYIIQIGDFGSFDSLSSFQKNDTQQGKLKDAFMVDILSLRNAIDTFNKALKNDSIPRHCTIGNHEMRVHKFEEKIPEIQGLMKKALYDTFHDRGWTTTEYGEFKFIGGVGFVHAPLNIMGKEYGGKNGEVQVANDTLHDVVFGHTHKHRDWKAPKIGDSQWVRIVNVGCSLPQDHVEEYAKLNMTGGSWGIVELDIWSNHIQDSKFISMSRLEKEYG